MPRQIFLVEDDHQILEGLTDILELEGYEVTCFENGKMAFDTLNVIPQYPDLIILDLMMPIMSGYEFITKFRALEKFNHVPLMLLSADYKAQINLGKNNIQAFMKKPIDLGPFLHVVDKLCQGQEQALDMPIPTIPLVGFRPIV